MEVREKKVNYGSLLQLLLSAYRIKFCSYQMAFFHTAGKRKGLFMSPYDVYNNNIITIYTVKNETKYYFYNNSSKLIKNSRREMIFYIL